MPMRETASCRSEPMESNFETLTPTKMLMIAASRLRTRQAAMSVTVRLLAFWEPAFGSFSWNESVDEMVFLAMGYPP